MNKARILMIDDDENICQIVKLYLEKEGFDATIANDGKTGINCFLMQPHDLILLDIMMPEMDGMEVLRELRKDSNVPVIMLTAKGETLDKVQALELGADDFIVKPFDAKELIARIKAVIRRSEASAEPANESITFDDLEISLATYTVVYKGKKMDLVPGVSRT